MRRYVPFLALVVLLLAAGLGLGLGLAQAPSATPPGASAVPASPLVTARADGVGTGGPRPDTASLAGAVVGGRFVAPVRAGGLTVDPAPEGTPPAPLGLDRAAAAALVGYTTGIGVLGPAGARPTVGFGLVTVRGVAPPVGTPTLDETPAWVGIVLGVNQGAFHCPAIRAASPPRPVVPEDRAVLFTGEGGRGAVLSDTGGSSPCGGPAVPPSLREASATVPVPWQQQGPAGLTTTVSYRAPACAHLGGVSTSGDVHTGVFHVEVEVSFPFARRGCGTVTTFTTTVTVFPPDAGPGAPAPPATVVLLPGTAAGAVPPSLVGPVPPAGPVAG